MKKPVDLDKMIDSFYKKKENKFDADSLLEEVGKVLEKYMGYEAKRDYADFPIQEEPYGVAKDFPLLSAGDPRIERNDSDEYNPMDNAGLAGPASSGRNFMMPETLREEASGNMGIKLEKDICTYAQRGLDSVKELSYDEQTIKNILKKLAQSNLKLNTLIDQGRPSDQDAKRINDNNSKTDIIVYGKKVSLKYGISQLASIEPHAINKQINSVSNYMRSNFPGFESSLEAIDSLAKQLSNFNSYYRLQGDDLRDAIKNRWGKRIDKKDLQPAILATSLIRNNIISRSDGEDFVKRVRETSPEQIYNMIYDVLSKQSTVTKKGKQIKSEKDYQEDKKIISNIIKNICENEQYFKYLIYDLASGKISKVKEEHKADYLLLLSKDSTIVLYKLDSPENVFNLLSPLLGKSEKVRIAKKARSGMKSALNIRFDLNMPIFSETEI